MKLKKRVIRWVFYRVVEGFFRLFSGLVSFLPLSSFRQFSSPIFKLLIYFLVPRRRIRKNLSAAFGATYASATQKGLAKGIQEHCVRNLVDCFIQLHLPEHAGKIVKVEGRENLEAGLAKGKGVIALGAHIGNFVLVGTRLGIEGYPFHILFRLPKDQRLKTIIDRYLPCFHLKIIPSFPRRVAVTKVLETLKRNEIVFILADNLKKGRVQTYLFGQPVRSPRGPVSLALRSGAAVLPIYLIRGYGGDLHVVIEPEIPMMRNGNLSADIAQNTHRIAHYLEGLIRRYPDQWSWLTVRMGRDLGPSVEDRSARSHLGKESLQGLTDKSMPYGS